MNEIEMQKVLEQNSLDMRLHNAKKWARRGLVSMSVLGVAVLLCWGVAIWLPNGDDLGLTGVLLIIPLIVSAIVHFTNYDSADELRKKGARD